MFGASNNVRTTPHKFFNACKFVLIWRYQSPANVCFCVTSPPIVYAEKIDCFADQKVLSSYLSNFDPMFLGKNELLLYA